MGEGNGVASVNMLTFTKMPGPHADTALAVVGQLAQQKLWFADYVMTTYICTTLCH